MQETNRKLLEMMLEMMSEETVQLSQSVFVIVSKFTTKFRQNETTKEKKY